MAVASLRSEIGASKVITRVMETVLLFAKETLEGEFVKVKRHMETEIKKNKGSWINRANSYLETLKLSWEQIRKMDRIEIKQKIREWDTETWKMEMSSKSTMKWYLEAKMKIKYDECYSNNTASKYLVGFRVG